MGLHDVVAVDEKGTDRLGGVHAVTGMADGAADSDIGCDGFVVKAEVASPVDGVCHG